MKVNIINITIENDVRKMAYIVDTKELKTEENKEELATAITNLYIIDGYKLEISTEILKTLLEGLENEVIIYLNTEKFNENNIESFPEIVIKEYSEENIDQKIKNTIAEVKALIKKIVKINIDESIQTEKELKDLIDSPQDYLNNFEDIKKLNELTEIMELIGVDKNDSIR